MQIENKNIIITGAGDGIGKEFVKILSPKNKLILLGRDIEKLYKLNKELNRNNYVLKCDISNEEDINLAYNAINNKFNKIDFLFNNAGISSAKQFDQYSSKEISEILNTNILGTILITKKFMNNLLQSKGCVVNIGSMFGDIAHPYYSIYSTSKFAIRGFSDAIRREYAHHGVKVFYVSPRATQTKSLAVTNNIGKHFKMNIDEPYTVANLIINNVEKNNFYIYPKTIERTFLFVQKLFPKLIDNNLSKIAKKIHYN
jgi:short-subunit dehydrogenase